MHAGEAPLPVVFFFSSRRRHTRFKCDWSSDVCSSDLVLSLRTAASHFNDEFNTRTVTIRANPGDIDPSSTFTHVVARPNGINTRLEEADLKSVLSGKTVDLGGRRIIKKKRPSTPTCRA